ncbi:MAG: methyltransferase domain-containing protein [Candidatus Methylomirabilis oxyfera]|nr:methyltransferase domain-containing protein [Candidatus Methylomirabilis oxyfera]
MAHLSVVVWGDGGGPVFESCRECLIRFTMELQGISEAAGDASLGSVMAQAPASFVAFLDHRIAVSPGWAARLIRALEGSGAAAIGPLSNGATGPQRRSADYQDIPGYLTCAERIARQHAGQVQAVDALGDFCIVCRRELLAGLDPATDLANLGAAIRAAGHQVVVALDTYVHSFAGYYDHSRPELEALIQRDARTVLDVGCGAGALGAALKRRGAVEVIGVEADPGAADAATRVLDRVHRGDIESLDLPYSPGTFDCIVLADILEHLRDPWGLLRRLAPLLAPHGRLIASLPNVRHWSVVRGLLGGDWTYLPAGILDQGHLRFFTLKSGRALFEAAGLRIVEVHPVGGGLVPDLTPLVEAGGALSLDCSTLGEEARVTQYLYVVERRG